MLVSYLSASPSLPLASPSLFPCAGCGIHTLCTGSLQPVLNGPSYFGVLVSCFVACKGQPYRMTAPVPPPLPACIPTYLFVLIALLSLPLLYQFSTSSMSSSIPAAMLPPLLPPLRMLWRVSPVEFYSLQLTRYYSL